MPFRELAGRNPYVNVFAIYEMLVGGVCNAF